MTSCSGLQTFTYPPMDTPAPGTPNSPVVSEVPGSSPNESGSSDDYDIEMFLWIIICTVAMAFLIGGIILLRTMK